MSAARSSAVRQAAKKAVIPSDERKRVAATFKDFCEPGTSKVSLSELPALVKELAKGTAAADPQVKKLISLAKAGSTPATTALSDSLLPTLVGSS